jgi:hypothetical protein
MVQRYEKYYVNHINDLFPLFSNLPLKKAFVDDASIGIPLESISQHDITKYTTALKEMKMNTIGKKKKMGITDGILSINEHALKVIDNIINEVQRQRSLGELTGKINLDPSVINGIKDIKTQYNALQAEQQAERRAQPAARSDLQGESRLFTSSQDGTRREAPPSDTSASFLQELSKLPSARAPESSAVSRAPPESSATFVSRALPPRTSESATTFVSRALPPRTSESATTLPARPQTVEVSSSRGASLTSRPELRDAHDLSWLEGVSFPAFQENEQRDDSSRGASSKSSYQKLELRTDTPPRAQESATAPTTFVSRAQSPPRALSETSEIPPRLSASNPPAYDPTAPVAAASSYQKLELRTDTPPRARESATAPTAFVSRALPPRTSESATTFVSRALPPRTSESATTLPFRPSASNPPAYDPTAPVAAASSSVGAALLTPGAASSSVGAASSSVGAASSSVGAASSALGAEVVYKERKKR